MSTTERRRSFRAWWDAWWEREQRNVELIAQQDPFQDWERSRNPEIGATSQVILGSKVLFAHGPEKLRNRFFENAVAISNRALSDEGLQMQAPGYPLNRAILLRDRFLSQAVLGSANETDARDAAADCAKYCAGMKKWNDMHEAYFLMGIRLRMIIGDDSVAKALSIRTLRYQAESQSILLSVLRERRASGVREAFDSYFDKIRDPEYRPGIFTEREVERLELSAIRHRTFFDFDGSIDWLHAMEAAGG